MVYTKPLLNAFLLKGPLRIHSNSYFVLCNCRLNGLRLATFCCAKPLFTMGALFFIDALSICAHFFRSAAMSQDKSWMYLFNDSVTDWAYLALKASVVIA